MITDDPIESYLDEVLLTTPGSPRQVRRSLAEIEDHLLASAESSLARGLSREQARAEAVRRFGPAAVVIDRPASFLRPPRVIRRQLVLTGLFVSGWAGLSAGLAGAIALLVRLIWGPAAIATAFPFGSYTAADCTRWLALDPTAADCQVAMVANHADDFIRNTAAALVLGLIALSVRFALRRRWKLWSHLALEAGIASVSAALVTLASLAIAFDSVTVTHGQGAGQPISLAIAAMIATTGLALRAKHTSSRSLFNARPA